MTSPPRSCPPRLPQTEGGATVTAGGLAVAAGGATVTAGGLKVTAGGATVVAGGLTVTAGGATVTAGGTTLTTTTADDAALTATSSHGTLSPTVPVLKVQASAAAPGNYRLIDVCVERGLSLLLLLLL